MNYAPLSCEVDDPRSLIERFRDVADHPDASTAVESSSDPLQDSLYLEECRLIIEYILGLLNKGSDEENSETSLPLLYDSEDDFPSNHEGYTVCFVALPFDQSCLGIREKRADQWDRFLREFKFIHVLMKSPDSGLTQFGNRMGRFYELLCGRLRQDVKEGGCSFVIHYPAGANLGERRSYFLKKCDQAQNNLLDFLLSYELPEEIEA